MNTETNRYETFRQETDADSGSATDTAQTIMDKGTEAYEKVEHAAGEAYDKTAKKVKETYEKAKHYSEDNPSKTIFIALGIGVGIGLLLGASSSHRSRTSRIAQPVINGLAEIAQGFFR